MYKHPINPRGRSSPRKESLEKEDRNLPEFINTQDYSRRRYTGIYFLSGERRVWLRLKQEATSEILPVIREVRLFRGKGRYLMTERKNF